MRCFIPVNEDLIMQLWLQDPNLVVPFSRPFFSACQTQETTSSETDKSDTKVEDLKLLAQS